MIPIYQSHSLPTNIFLSANLDFPVHLHTQLELLYVMDGALEMTIGSCSRILTAGEFALAFPNQVHSYKTSGESRSILAILSPSQAGAHFHRIVRHHPANPFLAWGQIHRDIPYAMKTLLQEGNCSADLCTAFLQLILARSLPLLELVPNQRESDDSVLHRLVRYISENFSQSITLESLSREIGTSKYHLSHLFSKKLHTSFNGYLNSFRLDMAKNLLVNTSQPVLQICYDCGFDSQRTFNRVFRQVTGTAPSVYRNQTAQALSTQRPPSPNPCDISSGGV